MAREISEWDEEDLGSVKKDEWRFVLEEVKEEWGGEEAGGSSSTRPHRPAVERVGEWGVGGLEKEILPLWPGERTPPAGSHTSLTRTWKEFLNNPLKIPETASRARRGTKCAFCFPADILKAGFAARHFAVISPDRPIIKPRSQSAPWTSALSIDCC